MSMSMSMSKQDTNFNALQAAYASQANTQSVYSGSAQNAQDYCTGGTSAAYVGGGYNSYPLYPYPYTGYTGGYTGDKTAQAFRIAKALMDKSMLEVETVPAFIEFINTVVGAL